jgi:hypothetical protein
MLASRMFEIMDTIGHQQLRQENAGITAVRYYGHDWSSAATQYGEQVVEGVGRTSLHGLVYYWWEMLVQCLAGYLAPEM